LKVSFGGNLPLWNKAGAGVVHAVDKNGTGDYAPMIWQDNVITLASDIAANDLAVTYYVDFTSGPAVYSGGGQATAVTDGMVIDILRADNSVLASYTNFPGAWAGAQTFAPASFQYVGDGSGVVRLRVGPLAATGRFCGAIDNLKISTRNTFLSEDFNGYNGGNQNALQFQSGLKVSFGGDLPLWNKAGAGVVHAVDKNGTGDFAPMIWQDNVITLASGIAANDLAATYYVEFSSGPAVYSGGGQATAVTDGMVIDVLRGDNSLLISHTNFPGAWAGGQTFAPASFQYVGDGSGVVRLRVGPLAATGRFCGAIDNLTVADFASIPPVVPPPAITNQPSGGTVAEGCTFTLTVGASNATGYAWYKNGTLIPGASRASLSVADASTNDAGSYTVVVTNTVGSVTSTPPAVLAVIARPTHSTVLLSENFNGYSGNQNDSQYQTGLKVAFGGNVTGWSKSGDGTMHAEDRTGSGNWAIMFYGGNSVPGANIITLTTGIGANEATATYFVDFVSGHACYSGGSQANTAADGLVVDVLRTDDTVLASYTKQPGDWVGDQSFATNSFSYVGDGSGPVRIRISPLANAGRFHGAIDNLRVATDYAPLTPPQITTGPVGGTVAEGSDFAFSVVATGVPTYQWRKGGNPITGATSASYSLSNVKLTDAGTYTVVLANASGSVTSTPAILSVTPGPTYASYLEAVLTDNPIHYYPLDETSGTAAADLGSLATSGGIYTGGFTLSQPAASSRLGNCIRLDGQPGTFVDLGLFHPGDNVTVEVWASLDFDASHSPSYHDLVGRMDGSYIIDFAPNDRVEFAAFNTGGTLAKVGGDNNTSRGRWHHLVGVFSGGTATVYVDGVQGTVQSIGGVLRDLGPTPDRVLIGASRDGSVNSFNFKGLVDEVAIYDTALSAAQIRAHYRAAQSPSQSLTVQRTLAGAVLVSWPSFSPGYVLQSSTNVTGPYENYTGSIVVQGNNLTAEVPPDSSQKFFRLFHP
jgi:Concanavalin A-like lectin/glucanases superfamily/Immunoglobulin domain